MARWTVKITAAAPNFMQEVIGIVEKQKKKTIQMPHTYVIIFAVVVLCAVLTYLIPVGSFQTQEVSYMMGDTEKTRTVIVADSFAYSWMRPATRCATACRSSAPRISAARVCSTMCLRA